MRAAGTTRKPRTSCCDGKDEELADYRQRLDNFQLTDAVIQSGLARIKNVFELGENEMMFVSFPSSFCTDDGRAIINAGAPPINKPTKEEARRTAGRTRMAGDRAARRPQGLRLLERQPETRWLQVYRAHHRLPRRKAGQCRSVLLLAEKQYRRVILTHQGNWSPSRSDDAAGGRNECREERQDG